MSTALLKVLNLSISAGYIILVVMVLRQFLRRAPKWICCAMWGLVALRLVCPFSLESALSLLPSGEAVSPAIVETGPVQPETVYIHSGFNRIDEPANRVISDLITPETSAAAAAGAPGEIPAESSSFSRASLAKVVSIAAIVWLCGAAVMVLYGAVSYLRLRRRVRTAVFWRDNLWQCETVDAPFVLGLIRPRVYLPFFMDPVAAAQVIAHEQAHIRRHDQLTKAFAWLLLSVYWFAPLVWGAYALLCRDIELACDEHVVRDMSVEARQRYARALLDWGAERPAVTSCPLAFGEVGLKERIKTVMRYKKPARWAAVLAVALIAASGACLLTSPMAEAVAPAPFRDAAENGQPTAADGVQIPVVPQTEPDRTAVQASPDPDVVPGPVSILTVRPRAVTAEETKAMATAIFGDGAIYEAAPETTERTPCDWTFCPTDEGAEAEDMSIRAQAELDGMLYTIQARNYEPPVTATGDSIHSLAIDLISPEAGTGTGIDVPARIDALCTLVNGWLEQAGLEYYAAAAAGETDGAVCIAARPLYEGLPLLPFDSIPLSGRMLSPGEDLALYFQFSGTTLISVRWDSPMEQISSQPLERPMSLRAAMAVAGLEDSLAALDWQFGYVPIPAGNGMLQLVPAYWHGASEDDPNGIGEVIVDAAEGTLLADARTWNEAPGTTPTPRPQVADLEVRWGVDSPIDYVETGWFSLSSGSSLDLVAIWYPQVVNSTPEWTVDDASVVTLQPDETGIRCHCELVGPAGTETVLHVKVNEKQADIRVLIL